MNRNMTIMEPLEDRRLLAAGGVFGDLNLGPNYASVICELVSVSYQRASVSQATDYWVSFYERSSNALADDLATGIDYFPLDQLDFDFLPGFRDSYIQGLREAADASGTYRAFLSEAFSSAAFPLVIPGGDGGSVFRSGTSGASFGGGEARSGDGQAKASRYDGGVFSDSSVAGNGGGASESITDSVASFASFGGVSTSTAFSDVSASLGFDVEPFRRRLRRRVLVATR